MMFEWQRFSHDLAEVPHYCKLLEFLNFRAQASETSISEGNKRFKSDASTGKKFNKPIASFTSTAEPFTNCVTCNAKHPLYSCPKFRSMTHENKFSLLKSNRFCINCLRQGHFVKQCKLSHCQKC